MKKKSLLFIILPFLSLLFFSCLSESSAKLEFSIPIYDFGSIENDSIYQGNIVVKNSGNAPLLIENINPGCGCTSVNISKETVLPKDTCLLTFFYNTHNRRGNQENFITIIANTDSIIHILQVNAYVQ